MAHRGRSEATMGIESVTGIHPQNHGAKENRMNTSRNTMSKNDNDRLPWQKFRTRDPHKQSVFLDRGRAEVMFNMIVAPDLTDERLGEFVGAAFGASNGNPDILRLAIEAFSRMVFSQLRCPRADRAALEVI